MGKIKDLTGQKFGRLKVINFSHKNKNIKYWNCLCDCGKEKIIIESHLKSSHTKSCGCLKKDLSIKIGEKYNNLTAIIQTNKKKRGAIVWLFKCDCGKEIEISGNRVKKGFSKSCGCIRKERCLITGEKSISYKGYNDLTGQHFHSIRKNAKERKLIFEINIEYLWNLLNKQNYKCIYSGMSIQFGNSYLGIETTASLDRIDSSKGYIEGNVQWVHKTINMMKNKLSEKDFLKWIDCIYEYRHKH